MPGIVKMHNSYMTDWLTTYRAEDSWANVVLLYPGFYSHVLLSLQPHLFQFSLSVSYFLMQVDVIKTLFKPYLETLQFVLGLGRIIDMYNTLGISEYCW